MNEENARELSYGEQAVGLNFNPGNDEKVQQVKELYASEGLSQQNSDQQHSELSRALEQLDATIQSVTEKFGGLVRRLEPVMIMESVAETSGKQADIPIPPHSNVVRHIYNLTERIARLQVGIEYTQEHLEV